ncbi:MAG: hypothetical protein AAFP98_13420, partial [Pseudomonadota bacterium]
PWTICLPLRSDLARTGAMTDYVVVCFDNNPIFGQFSCPYDFLPENCQKTRAKIRRLLNVNKDGKPVSLAQLRPFIWPKQLTSTARQKNQTIEFKSKLTAVNSQVDGGKQTFAKVWPQTLFEGLPQFLEEKLRQTLLEGLGPNFRESLFALRHQRPS